MQLYVFETIFSRNLTIFCKNTNSENFEGFSKYKCLNNGVKNLKANHKQHRFMSDKTTNNYIYSGAKHSDHDMIQAK